MSNGNEPDFIDTDLSDQLDPQVLEAQEDSQRRGERLDEAQLREYLENRKRYYTEVFSQGHTSQDAIDFVMNDLAKFCRAFHPTYDKMDGVHADTLMKMKEGRREVFGRIADHAHLDRTTLFLKYTNAQFK